MSATETDGRAADERTPWGLLTGLLAEQKRGLITGVLVGLAWAACKVSIPSLIENAIDHGIRGNQSLLMWSLIIGGVGVLSGIFVGWRRW
ncbi:MAG: putative transporter permease/ATP-binding protein, partial [Ilumatobacteraceae bacterium]|nr:putative transporter permease/ATP-binding protein [Ilumatobacteraceae bacterium]